METSIKPQTQSLEVNRNAPRDINLGNVFYVVRLVKNGLNNFRAKCDVCNGERKITVNDITFNCPMCATQKLTLSVYQYVVRRVRVFSKKEVTLYDDWKASDYRDIIIEFYHKEGRGRCFWSNDNFTCDFSIKTIKENLNKKPLGADDYFNEDCAIFDDYQLAVETADILTARELQRLEQYNAEHSTNYVATFDAKNDAKSN